MLLRIFDRIAVVVVYGSLPFFVFLQGSFNYYWDYATTVILRDESPQIYDFIVGGGSSGAVIANRLSKNNKVLLLEAGGDPIYYNSIPGFQQELLHRPEVDWLHNTVPQKGFIGERTKWPRGKVLGGSSSLNSMLYLRGSPHDYNRWSNISGDPTWHYENVLPFFKKSLVYNGEYKENVKHYGQNTDGNLNVEKREWKFMFQYFADAGKELGFLNRDLNGPLRSGLTLLDVTQKNGQRWGTYHAYLRDILSRKNLRVSRYSQAIEIKLDRNRRAVGVWYIRHGKRKFARASKEIIISGGSVDSPKLLMLSGIGPKNHLKSLRIVPKVDLPVGQNLVDHVAALIVPILIEKPELSFFPERDMGIKTFTDYFFHGTGNKVLYKVSQKYVHIGECVWTVPTCVHSHLLFCSSFADCKNGTDWPDIQLYFSPIGVYENSDTDYSRVFGIELESLKKYFSPFKGNGAFFLASTILRPKSVGEITLKDKNPLTPPVIDPRYLDHPDDIKMLVEGVKLAVKIAEETRSFKRLNAHLPNVPFPGCESFEFKSDDYWNCFARHWAITLYHPVGTCRMGSGTKDPKAVVDSRLRVLNTIGLRVADASIMPEIVSGNTNAPAILIGEKASDFIRDYWSQQFLVSNRFEMLRGQDFKGKCYYSKFV